jgi:hypothetical protein
MSTFSYAEFNSKIKFSYDSNMYFRNKLNTRCQHLLALLKSNFPKDENCDVGSILNCKWNDSIYAYINAYKKNPQTSEKHFYCTSQKMLWLTKVLQLKCLC